jgi:hypothetical protein
MKTAHLGHIGPLRQLQRDGLIEGALNAPHKYDASPTVQRGIAMIYRITTATSLLLAATGAFAAPTKTKPVSTVIITNARDIPATDVAIGVNGQTVRLTKPLAPKAKTTLRLPKMTGCMVAVAATFEDESTAEFPELDVCQDGTVRFTD